MLLQNPSKTHFDLLAELSELEHCEKLLMKPLLALPGNPKGCTYTRKIVTKRRSSWPHFFGQNCTPNPQYAPESLGIDPELQICHEIICKAFVFEKNRTARIPVSGVERYGAPKLWSVARCYARRRHNGFSTPNLLRVPGKKLGLGVGLGGEEKQGEIRSQLKAAPPHY